MSNYPQGWQPPQHQQLPPQRPPMPYQQPQAVIYDGNAREQIGLQILLALLVIISLGIGAPYAICALHKEDAAHTIIGGRRLRFDGTAGELFLNMLGWGILTVITLGLYAFWARVEYKKWIAENTHFA